MAEFCPFLKPLSKLIRLQGLFIYTGIVFWIAGCTEHRGSLSAPPPAQRMEDIAGATLDRIRLQQNNVVYVQTIDLHKMAIEQLTGAIDRRKAGEGYYYPDKKQISSPFFARLTIPAVLQNYQKLHGSKLFSIINASFFEDYERSTRLSFPIKLNGKVVTTGSSPYGPIQKPADAYYRNIQLKTLTWNDTQASVLDYNLASGYPLSQSNIANAVVSYAYQDHPAYALAGDPVNRYHVLGVLQKEQNPQANRLLIATTNRSTLKEAAEILRQQGATSDLMTIDGGISTYLWTMKSGDLVLPKVAEGEKEAALPHYLSIRAKN
jgi:hypothetical protein